MKRITVIIGTLIFLVSCVSTPSSTSKPDWVDNKYVLYPDAKYLVEIGLGSSLKNARENGAASLAQIFKTSIKVETTIQTRYKELSSNDGVEASEETNFDQDITQLADQELINVNFGESWTNELGQVHVIAYIDRQETGMIYRERIMKNNEAISDFINRSGDQASQIRKFAYLDAAYVVAQANEVLLEQLEIINLPMSKIASGNYDLNDLRDNQREAARSMVFRIDLENDDDGKLTALLIDELTSFGFSVADSGNLTVSGSITFEKVELNNDLENMKYYLNIRMEDEDGIPAVAMESNDRISAVSESDVYSRSYREIEKVIKKDLIGQLIEYLDGFVK